MKKLFILTVCLLSTVSARFTQEDIKAEVTAYESIVSSASTIVDPLYVQVKEAKAAISAPIDAQLEPLRLEKDVIQGQIYVLNEEEYRLSTQFRNAKKHLESEFEISLRASLAPMQEELQRLRSPIQERVKTLVVERDAIEREHYRLKADPVWGRWMDGTESFNTALRMAGKDEAIKALYDSVDGDLPFRIEEKRTIMTEEHYAQLRTEEAYIAEAIDAITRRKVEFSSIESSLFMQIQSLERQKSAAIVDAMPHTSALLQAIQGQVVNELISGVIIPIVEGGSSAAASDV